MRTIGPIEILVILLTGMILAVVYVIPFWQIFRKAGYPGPLALLMFLPVVNVVMLWYLAFSRWPVHREAEGSRQPPSQ